jgi:hypothetical protein
MCTPPLPTTRIKPCSVLSRPAAGLACAGKAPAELRIYDPYFCAGGTVRNLAALGFTHVINRNEDFYLAIEEGALSLSLSLGWGILNPLRTMPVLTGWPHAGTVPEHDVVVTNPPYSEDHVARALTFCAANLATHGRPWLMLLPNYVYAKDYYRPALREGAREGVEQRAKADATVFAEGGPEAIPLGCSAADAANAFYIAPKKRYYYWTPKVRTSPWLRCCFPPKVIGRTSGIV